MKKNKCITEKPWKFLFWKGISKYEEHNWAYRSKERRYCDKCGRTELYFGIVGNGTITYEDWRPTKLGRVK